MAALVAAERHLWLTLSDIKDRVFLFDAPLAPSGLFGDTVNSVVDRFQEARKQAVAFQRFLPRHSLAQGAAGREQPQPCACSSYREEQKVSVATCTPPRERGSQKERRSRLKTSKTKVDLRTVLLAKKSSTKKPWCLCPRASEGSPRWGRPVYTSLHGARLSPVPSGDWAVNPAAAGASGHSSLQRAHIPVSARSCRRRRSPTTPKVSLERLIPFVDFLPAWTLLSNISKWVLQTVERGYRIQFSSPPPRFNGIVSTVVGPE